MFVLISILGLFFIGFFEFIFSLLIDSTVLDFVIIGPLIIGIIYGVLIGYSAVITNKKITKRIYIFGIVMATLIYVVSADAYVAAMNIKQNAGINVFEYLQYIIKYGDVEIKGSTDDSGLIFGGVLKNIYIFIKIYILDISAFCGIWAVKHSNKECERCNKYYRTKILFSFDSKDENYINGLVDNMNAGDGLPFTNKIGSKSINKEEFSQIIINYCPQCYDGKLIIKSYIYDKKKKEQYVRASKEIKIDNVVVKQILGTIIRQKDHKGKGID